MKRLLILALVPLLALAVYASMKITSSDGTVQIGTNLIAVQAFNLSDTWP